MKSHHLLWLGVVLSFPLVFSSCKTSDAVAPVKPELGLIDPSAVTPNARRAMRAVTATATGLKVVATEAGKLSFSADGAASNDPAGTTIQINKPNAAVTLRKAVLACASYAARVINDGDVSLDGTPIVWSQNVANPIGTMPWFDSVISDVTAAVKAKTDAAPVGIVNFSETEVSSPTIDGCALYAIFDDPTQISDSTVILLFGGQRTTGDSFSVSLGQPVDKSLPNQVLDLSLATSYGYQGALSTAQYSEINVNGTRISSASGGQDDCDIFTLPANECAMNGGLITVGGGGDANNNPFNPLTTATTNARSDDELYNLLPFVNNADSTVTVSTRNPSNDDNIFAAAVVTSYNATGIPTNTNVPPTVSPNYSSVVVNRGDMANNTGVYADADGDPVTLTASMGTLTQGTGTWNWSYDSSTNTTRDQIVTITASDDKGHQASTNFALTVLAPNKPPTVSIDIKPAVVDEGKKFSSTLTVSDPDGDSVSLTASIGRISDNSLTGIWSWSFDTVDGPSQSQNVTITATDSRGGSSAITFPLVVNNLLPVIASSGVLVSATTLGVNVPMSANASFKDGGVLDTHTAVWNWGDGTTSAATVVETAGSGSVADSHSYTASGSYIVTLTVTDKDGGSTQASSKVINVANNQKATGKSRIASPLGAYSANPSLTGNADFEFTSVFAKGSSLPSGKVNLRLSAVKFDFLSTTQESLVVDGMTARIRGTGTLNGTGRFGFLIVATDGGTAPNTDSFRIKIWDMNNGNAVVYDNAKGQPDSANVGSSVTGDSITVNK